MPSSSTRNTTQELTLQVSWRIAYTHLHDLGAHAFAEWVTEGFAVVLDIGSEDLISSAGTREHGRDDCNDRQVSDAIRAQGARMSEAEQVEAAATACMEAAEALGQFGREKEGEDFVEMGEFFCCISGVLRG